MLKRKIEAIEHVRPCSLLYPTAYNFTGFSGMCPPKKTYLLSLIAIHYYKKHLVVLRPEVIERAKACPGCLVVEDIGVEKYGMQSECRVLFKCAKRHFGHGYKLLLFLWHCVEGNLLLGFALWAKALVIFNDIRFK